MVVSELVELSFVGNKGNKQWVWIAIDQLTREIIGIYVGSRDKNSAECLWASGRCRLSAMSSLY